jgi:hypothetical protein
MQEGGSREERAVEWERQKERRPWQNEEEGEGNCH